MSDGGESQQVNLPVDADLAGGAHASFAAVWHTEHEFTLDFFAASHPGNPPHLVHTARVRVPPSVIFNVARTIADNVAIYESNFGAITVRGEDGDVFPPNWEEGGQGDDESGD